MGQEQSSWSPQPLPDPCRVFESAAQSGSVSGTNVADDANRILARIRNVAPLWAVCSGATITIPSAVLAALSAVLDLMKTTSNMASQLETYINDELCRASLVTIRSKVVAINASMGVIVNPAFEERSRYTEAIAAKQTLISMLDLLKNDSNLHRKSILTTPLLLSCCPAYIAIYGYILQSDPRYAGDAATHRNELIELLKMYRRKCLAQRMEHIDGDSYDEVCIGHGSVSFFDRFAELTADTDVEYEYFSRNNDRGREFDYRYHFKDTWEGLNRRSYTDETYINSYRIKVEELYNSRFQRALDELNRYR